MPLLPTLIAGLAYNEYKKNERSNFHDNQLFMDEVKAFSRQKQHQAELSDFSPAGKHILIDQAQELVRVAHHYRKMPQEVKDFLEATYTLIKQNGGMNIPDVGGGYLYNDALPAMIYLGSHPQNKHDNSVDLAAGIAHTMLLGMDMRYAKTIIDEVQETAVLKSQEARAGGKRGTRHLVDHYKAIFDEARAKTVARGISSELLVPQEGPHPCDDPQRATQRNALAAKPSERGR